MIKVDGALMEEYGYELSRDHRVDRTMYWSEVYGRWIPLDSIQGFCPVCNTPLLSDDIGEGYCGYCGALFGDDYKEVV